MANEKVGSKATADGRSKLPYKIGEVSKGEVTFTFDGEEYTVGLSVDMLKYLLDAGLRTRISAAGAGKMRGLPDMVKACEGLAAGKFGRVGFDADELMERIKSAELDDIPEIRQAIQNAPKSKQAALAVCLSDRVVELVK